MTTGDKTTYKYPGVALIGLAIAISTGCTSEPVRVEADYGNSVNQLVQAATYNPEAAASTESVPVLGMDGRRAMKSLDALEADTKRPESFDDIFSVRLNDD